MEIPDALVNELVKNPLFKTDTRAIFFLLQNPEPVSFDVIADATGVSRKCVNRSIKRLTEAGLIQPGEVQPRTQRFNVTGWEHLSPPPVTEKIDNTQSGDFEARFNRLEALILNNGDGSGATSGQDQTGTVPLPSYSEPEVTCLDKTEPVIISTVTELVSSGITNGQNVPELDAIVSISEPSITRTQELEKQAALAASLYQERQKQQPGARTGIDAAEFHALFGVHLPAGSDPAAVGVMIARKKAGKLDVKSPLAYLNSLSGKIQSPILADVSTVPDPVIKQSIPVTEIRLDHEKMAQINAIWDAMTPDQRIPFETTALPKFEKQVGRFKVPLHLLAKGVFNAQYIQNHQ
jgi:predicted transcriptional regulator